MIRNLLFKIFFFLGIIIICIIFLPALFFPQKITLLGGKIMGHWAKYCLMFFLSVKIKIIGKTALYQVYFAHKKKFQNQL